MIKVKDTKRCKIKSRIVQIEGVRALCKLLDEQKTSDEGQFNLSFSITYKDDSRTESSDKAIFGDGTITNSQPISSIRLYLHEFYTGKKVEIYFASDCYSESYFSVSGDDDIWVRGLFDKIQQIIQSFPPQSPLCSINYFFAQIAMMLVISIFILLFFYYFTAAFVTTDLLKILTLPALILSFWAVTLVQKLFPVVEIQVGAQHAWRERNWRALFGVIFSMVILPFVITFIYDRIFSK
ncbi:hypothetical protein [Vampirovibrio sp.]|uniref:hypothetical protein n=1 Tax=Vampirovibrio sp. TaxID=2717857 RepID=UPI0035945E40